MPHVLERLRTNASPYHFKAAESKRCEELTIKIVGKARVVCSDPSCKEEHFTKDVCDNGIGETGNSSLEHT